MYRSLAVVVVALAALAAPAARAEPVTFTATLTGAAEAPPNLSPATGFATVVFDLAAHTMAVDVSFEDLQGTTTAAHIHCCVDAPGTASVATETPFFVGFPAGVTAGSYAHTFDMTLASSFSPSFISSSLYGQGSIPLAEQALYDGLLAGRAYFNIHTNVFPGGEIRGFLQQQVPEPASVVLVGLALAALPLSARRRQRSSRALA